ncbi:MAG: winged helix-turn-helix domain-containing protein [Anaerolineales bacterium]|jgi:predicted transcriptional regulator
MTEKDFQPAPTMTITDLDTLKVFSDPLRVQILEALAHEPQTVNQVAEKMGVSSSKLYYHINLLEKHNLIQVVDTTIHGNIIEKHYWVSALDIRLDKNLCCFGSSEEQENATSMMVVPLETTREDIIRSLEARRFALDQGAEEHPRQVVIYREVSKLSDKQANELIARIKALTKEFEAASNQEKGEDVQTHALTIAFYPSFHYEGAHDENEKEE